MYIYIYIFKYICVCIYIYMITSNTSRHSCGAAKRVEARNNADGERQVCFHLFYLTYIHTHIYVCIYVCVYIYMYIPI